ncbi:MAG: hypothetical protein ACE5FS_03395 [Paracoccaceae bacterium]
MKEPQPPATLPDGRPYAEWYDAAWAELCRARGRLAIIKGHANAIRNIDRKSFPDASQATLKNLSAQVVDLVEIVATALDDIEDLKTDINREVESQIGRWPDKAERPFVNISLTTP